MVSTLALTALTLALPAAAQDAPDRLFTSHGVELRADENVFLLFAALNAAGYAEESERKGPPLRAPVYHDIRVSVRDALRKYRTKPAVQSVVKVFEANAVDLETYIAAALADGGLSKAAKGLQPKLKPALDKFRQEVDLIKVFDDLADAQRTHAKKLLAGVNSDLSAAVKMLGDAGFRAPTNLVVVPNPLDSHGLTHRVQTKDAVILIVGPDAATARRAILEEALRPTIKTLVAANYRSAKIFRRSWDSLKSSRRIVRRYKDGQNYLTEALTSAMAYRVAAKAAGKSGREADEEFVDEQAKNSMRWARGALRVLDKMSGKTFQKDFRLGPRTYESVSACDERFSP